MPRLSYRERVRNVLARAAKDDEPSLYVAEILNEVCDAMERDSLPVGPNVRYYVFKALTQERRARRLVLERDDSNLPVLSFTPSGTKHFREVGTFPLYKADDVKLDRLTIPEVVSAHLLSYTPT
ncbi:hypothetical protein FKP32DRAFT_1682255 [Trametes sanguinea]|nr:hypothetical protein FKP32DRAFT_1682255 [Trametes sanguinea]